MDRRKRKTREAIFIAFTELLAKKDFSQITVGEIIAKADVGRATFYAHFETKDFLMKEFCEDLFCHIIDAAQEEKTDHRHIFSCDAPNSVFLHLLQHLQRNDNHILELLSSRNNALFMKYFKSNLEELVIRQLPLFADRKNEKLPDSFWTDHIASVFVETVRWWADHGMKESPETIAEYFMLAV
ncbi:MAG: TetR/AcrR family transcriptional regulator [Anaerotignum sp.]|nr:TetR/AcrR family transcriptional regulator [Anaerotignum sp.]MBQ7103148.1 TetR/AcrR family transcriptional regulator [Anaerotignum sp.]